MNARDIILDDMDGLFDQIAEKLNELMNKTVVMALYCTDDLTFGALEGLTKVIRSIDDQMDMLDTELEYLRKVME